MTAGRARCYEVEAPGRGVLRERDLPPATADRVLIETDFTGVSPGTERLVGLGLVPASCATAMACEGMQGTFALPIVYGYSLVGTIRGGQHTGERVFTMHPHQDRAVVAVDRLVRLPEAVPAPRATLLPNLETALNAVWDAELRGDETVAVIGGGAVGLLVAFALSHQHRGEITLVELDPARRERAARLAWIDRTTAPDEFPPESAAVTFHATGTGDGLQLALDAVGFEGRVVELSWYGERPVTLQLGGAFHYRRKRLIASQVGNVAPSHRAAGRAARTRAVLELLTDERLDALLETPIPFAGLPAFFADLYGGKVTAPCPLVGYSGTP